MLEWFEADGSDWLLRGAIRDRVRFAEHNVLSDSLPPGPFDLILCRNMLFYLTPEHRKHAVQAAVRRARQPTACSCSARSKR